MGVRPQKSGLEQGGQLLALEQVQKMVDPASGNHRKAPQHMGRSMATGAKRPESEDVVCPAYPDMD
jgi:hypothetical protein